MPGDTLHLTWSDVALDTIKPVSHDTIRSNIIYYRMRSCDYSPTKEIEKSTGDVFVGLLILFVLLLRFKPKESK